MLIWGSNYSIIKMGLSTLDPFLLTALRFLLCAFPCIFFVKRPNGYMRVAALYGLIFGIGLWGMVNLAIDRGISPGLAALLLQLSAFFTIVWGMLFFKESIHPRQWMGMIISLIGFFVIVALTKGWNSFLGILLVLIGALSWSLCNVLIKKYRPPDLLAFIVWSSLFSAVPLFVLTYVVKGSTPFLTLPHALTGSAIFSLLFQAYITTIFGYGVWSFLLREYSAAQVAPLSLLVPIFGFASAYWLFHETLSPLKMIGVLIMLMGMGVFLTPRRFLQYIKW